jgi:hypothetical protein
MGVLQSAVVRPAFLDDERIVAFYEFAENKPLARDERDERSCEPRLSRT